MEHARPPHDSLTEPTVGGYAPSKNAPTTRTHTSSKRTRAWQRAPSVLGDVQINTVSCCCAHDDTAEIEKPDRAKCHRTRSGRNARDRRCRSGKLKRAGQRPGALATLKHSHRVARCPPRVCTERRTQVHRHEDSSAHDAAASPAEPEHPPAGEGSHESPTERKAARRQKGTHG